jgi:hypothetical protein
MSDMEFGVLPSEVNSMLRLGIFKKLHAKYKPHFEEQTKYLCASIINYALAEKASNGEAQRYMDDNGCLITQQAVTLHNDIELAMAFSVLYSFTLVQLGPKNPERTFELAERAGRLHILLRTTDEIYPTNDAMAFLHFVRKYAEELIKN